MGRNAQRRPHGVGAERSTTSADVGPRPAQVLWVAPPGAPTSFPCVDCGLLTGNFCEGGPRLNYEDLCFASLWVPQAYEESSQRTPLCTFCETLSRHCRFCRGEEGCTPATRAQHWSGSSDGRGFDQLAFMAATIAEWSGGQTSAKCGQTAQPAAILPELPCIPGGEAACAKSLSHHRSCNYCGTKLGPEHHTKCSCKNVRYCGTACQKMTGLRGTSAPARSRVGRRPCGKRSRSHWLMHPGPTNLYSNSRSESGSQAPRR